MTRLTKFKIISWVTFFVIFLIIWTSMHSIFKDLAGYYIAGISGGLTALLSPRVQTTKTQSGNQSQIYWIFLKKAIPI